MFLADKMKGINSFDYIEEFNTVTKEYTESILKEVFIEKNEILSIIKSKISSFQKFYRREYDY